ncbi:TPA: restriction endonuclease subunit S [Acinetobacter baumannii]|nr:restriction endonuclease subunit S [Acinetobacter baumannii]
MINSIEYIEFGKIAEFRNGLNFTKDNKGTGCPIIGVADFKDYFSPNWDDLNEINPIGIVKKDDYLIKGDIIFVRSNGNKKLVGRSLYINKDMDALYSGFCIRARLVSNIIDPIFLAYFTKTDYFKSLISYADGTNINNLSQSILAEVKIPLYCMNTQKKITNVLSVLDEKIDVNKSIINKLESLAKLLYDYWFLQNNFPNIHGNPYQLSGGKMVDAPLLNRQVPYGWEVKELSDIANITMGQSPDGSSYNENREGEVFYQGSTDFGDIFPKVRQYTTEPARMAKKGDILLSVRAPVGDMNIANTDCCIGRGLAALNSKDGFDGFLFYVMKYFKQVFDRRNSEGTTFGSITKNDLYSLKLAYPPKELLEKYDNIVSKYNEMIFIRSMENQKLEELRDWLLPMLMNGQISIRDAEEHLAKTFEQNT